MSDENTESRRSTYIGARHISLFRVSLDSGLNGEVTAFLGIQHSSEHARRIEVGNAVRSNSSFNADLQ